MTSLNSIYLSTRYPQSLDHTNGIAVEPFPFHLLFISMYIVILMFLVTMPVHFILCHEHMSFLFPYSLLT